MDVTKKFLAEEAKEHAHKGLKRAMHIKTKKVHKKAKTPRYKSVPKAKEKIEKTLHETGKKVGKIDKVAKSVKEFAKGRLHSGSKTGPLVKNKDQALAIGYSEQRKANKAKK